MFTYYSFGNKLFVRLNEGITFRSGGLMESLNELLREGSYELAVVFDHGGAQEIIENEIIVDYEGLMSEHSSFGRASKRSGQMKSEAIRNGQ